MEMRSVNPYDSRTLEGLHYYQNIDRPFGNNGDWRTGRGGKTQYYFWKEMINNKNYFPGLGPGGPQGSWMKWLRNSMGGALARQTGQGLCRGLVQSIPVAQRFQEQF